MCTALLPDSWICPRVPANLDASKILDAYSLLPGHVCQQHDGTHAFFTQALLRAGPDNVITWAMLLKELQPASFTKLRDPVVIVKKRYTAIPKRRDTMLNT